MKVNEEITLSEAKQIYHENKGKIVNDECTSFVSLKDINKIYPNNVQAVFDFNLDIDKNDFVALVGPSGCGKSTTLRMIAGLEEISSGHLYINSVYSNYLESKDRDIAMVFQSYALYPQLTVYDNIGFGLTIRKELLPKLDKNGNPEVDENGEVIKIVRHYTKKEIEERVFKAADILDLGKYLDRRPKELSGGQMQRVALGRAIVRNAQIFLMDEPLSNLDAKLRVQMRSEIVKIHEEVGATTIYVTHDQTEAMTMANKIVVMNKGFIQQIGAPMEVYENPKNKFVATFIGTPPMNILQGTYSEGTVYLNSGVSFKLTEEQIKQHDTFYVTKISYINREIEKIEEEKDLLYARKILLGLTANSVKEEDDDTAKFKKERFVKIKKIISKIKNTSAKKMEAEQDEIKLIIEKLKEIVDIYNSNLVNPHNVEVGIRPEHIYLKENSKENCSDPFTVHTDIVEILGSEFVAYGKYFNDKVTLKLQDPIKPHTDYEVVFNKSRVHMFDLISTENIFY